MLTINDSTLSNNEACLPDGFGPGTCPFGAGGAIYNLAGTVVINRSTLNNNATRMQGNSGGAIHNTEGDSVTISYSTVRDNSAVGLGGAIHNDTGTVIIDHSTFSGNTASSTDQFVTITGRGSAIWNNDTLIVSNSTFNRETNRRDG